MSRMIKCKICQTEMASDAKACPKCEAPIEKKGCMTYIIYIGGGIFGLSILSAILGAIFDGNGKKPESTSSSASTSSVAQSSTQSASREETVIDVNADDLYKAYEANEVAADERYKDKLVKVHGVVQSIGKDILDNPYVVLGGEGMLDGVQCTFPDNASSKTSLSKMNKGDNVWVKGVVEGKMGNVQVEVR